MCGTHKKVHSIQFIWDKKYYFSVFGWNVTDTFVMGLLYVKIPKNTGKLCINLTNYHEKCLVKLNKGNKLGLQLMNWYPNMFSS